MSTRHRNPLQAQERLSTPGQVSCSWTDHDGHCLTCSDEAVPVKVLSIDQEAGLVLVAVRDQTEEIDITLVEDVAPGDTLLAHGGVAIARLEVAPIRLANAAGLAGASPATTLAQATMEPGSA